MGVGGCYPLDQHRPGNGADMTQKEWLSKSEDWRDGYNAFAHCHCIVNWEEKSEQWHLGFAYACNTVGMRGQTIGTDEGDAAQDVLMPAT